MSSPTAEILMLFGAALVLVMVLGTALLLAAWAAYQARRGHREAKALRREVLTASRNMVRMLEFVVRLDPSGTLGREAASMAAGIRSAQARIASGGVTAEAAPLPAPRPLEAIEPPSLEEQWALDVEANDWCDEGGIPLPETEKEAAEAYLKAYRAREKQRKEKVPC